ncbi:hypothetical protein BX616_011176 [Lobosporangium transversale]|nr:hypothetical protein BX616_011176 [Lobosporangium transversale]
MSNVTHMTNMSSMSFKENRTVSAIVETDSSDINYDHKHNDSPDHNHNHNHNISQSKADNSSTALSHINHNHSYNADHNGNSNNSNSNNNSSNSSIARNHVSHNHDHSHNFNSSKGQILISWGDSPNSGLRLSMPYDQLQAPPMAKRPLNLFDFHLWCRAYKLNSMEGK